MKKILVLALLVGLSGCGNNKIEKLVKDQLKDPQTAEFKNVKGKCGEVNAKNSYGGYIGYKRFVVEHDEVIFDSEDDHERFGYLWLGRCSDMDISEKISVNTCASVATASKAMLGLRLVNSPIENAQDIAKRGAESAIAPTLKIIDAAYKFDLLKKDRSQEDMKNEFAMSMFTNCVENKQDFGQTL
ncbi:hypothetical protein ACG93R_19995 [Acinetobacter guillouiae]|uniref:hypothetical protein n=1 Tax=Acinetobacter guillouiae TaxID=106649 RepID=UPI003AF4E422